MSLNIQPISFSEFQELCDMYHSTHDAPQGWKFGCAVNWNNEIIVGGASVGRPVSRHLDDGMTLEVTRTVIRDDLEDKKTKNACSKLYGACWRAVRALGYKKLISYTLKNQEEGIPLKAAGFEVVHQSEGGSWDSNSRPRIDKSPTVPKERWEKWQESEKVDLTS